MCRRRLALVGTAVLLAVAGCEKKQPAPKPSVNLEVEKSYQELQRRAKIGAQLEAEAGVVLETINVPIGSVRIVRSSPPSGSNMVVLLAELDRALGQTSRSNAVVRISYMTTEEGAKYHTNVVSELRGLGFKSVCVVFERWGMRFPGPEI